jgi:hypothetical protein
LYPEAAAARKICRNARLCLCGGQFPGITRSFTSFSQAAQENADARVYAGIHFRTTCTDGLRQGKKVGRFAFKHYLKPIKNHGSEDDDDDN